MCLTFSCTDWKKSGVLIDRLCRRETAGEKYSNESWLVLLEWGLKPIISSSDASSYRLWRGGGNESVEERMSHGWGHRERWCCEDESPLQRLQHIISSYFVCALIIAIKTDAITGGIEAPWTNREAAWQLHKESLRRVGEMWGNFPLVVLNVLERCVWNNT